MRRKKAGTRTTASGHGRFASPAPAAWTSSQTASRPTCCPCCFPSWMCAPHEHTDAAQRLTLFLPQARLRDGNWRLRESAILALGAVAEGCDAGLAHLAPQIIQGLLPVLDDARPLVSRPCAVCLQSRPVDRDVRAGSQHFVLDAGALQQVAGAGGAGGADARARTDAPGCTGVRAHNCASPLRPLTPRLGRRCWTRCWRGC